MITIPDNISTLSEIISLQVKMVNYRDIQWGKIAAGSQALRQISHD